jgi:glycolate oxidase iron-sulfur subunit
VGVVAGCVQRVYFGSANEATVRVLRAEGCDAVVPEQGCCGALSLHAGRGEEARQFAKAMIHAFENAGEIDAVVVNAAGCGSAMKEYARLFEDDPAWRDRARALSARVRDVTELLAGLPPRAARGPVPERVAYHDACHLAHAQGIRAQPRQLLAAIPGLSVCEIPGADQCCGSAGIYNIVEPERANEIGRRKVDAILSTRPEAIVTANPGCTLHLRALLRARGADVPSFHPVEILDRSIAAGRESPAPDPGNARGSTRAPR